MSSPQVAASPAMHVGAPGSAGSAKRVSMPDPRTPPVGHTPTPPFGRRSAGARTPSAGRRTPSAGRLSAPKTPSSDRLTPMPDYMRPIVRSAVRRWKKLHEDHMIEKLSEKRNVRKEQNIATRQEARKIKKRIPLEILAREWLDTNNATVETRAFLVDKVLPTLILGVEKLLIEVDNRGLADSEVPDPNFNPINFIAQYLLRNNPRYSNFSEASPYIRGLREVGEELKQELFDIEENKLARIKAEAKRKREVREEAERLRQVEKTRRETELKAQFSEWKLDLSGKIDLALVQNALRSFVEITEHYPPELQVVAQLAQELEPTDDTGRKLTAKEFHLYLDRYVHEMPSEIFDQFVQHMSRCASAYHLASEREERRATLTKLFVDCDHTGVGLLDRHRILNLFEMFYDKARESTKASIRDPRQWPVVEVQEIDMELTDAEEEQEEPDPKLIDNNVDVTEATKAAEKKETAAKTDKGENRDPSALTELADMEEKVKADEKETEQEKEQKPEEPTESTELKEEEKPAETTEEEKPTETTESEKPAEPKEEEKPAEEDAGGQETVAQKKDEEGAPADEAEKEEGEDGVAESEEKDREAAKTEETEEAKAEETDKEKAASELPEKEKDEAEEKPKEGETEDKAKAEKPPVTLPDDEQEPELTELVDSLPPRTGDRPPLTQQSKVSFAEGTTFERERTMLTSQGTRSQSQASIFDENTLNMPQFVHLTETFLGDYPEMDIFNLVVRFIREGYVETEEEKMERLLKARREAMSAKRKTMLNSLFEMWDNDGSGYLDFDEVETVMKKYKDGMEEEAIEIARKEFRKKHKVRDSRLSKREFRDFIHLVVSKMAGDDAFDYFVEFLIGSVERSYTERVRGEARKKWLQQVISAAETSGASMEPVYRAVFQALYKDAETHGGGKKISANISMLEHNVKFPNRGETFLRYVAATPEDAPFLLGRILYKDMRGISFAAVESGKPIHVPRVNNHGNIYFWNFDRDEDNTDGSFIVVPLKDRRKRVFGLLGMDTLYDPHSRAIFITHEIQYFQGVAKAFSIAYHFVDVRQKTMRISESAISWIHRRSPHVHEITIYMMEPDGKDTDYVMRKMMTTDERGNAVLMPNPPRLERKDNLFRDYLFKCVDNSESVTADAYGQRHLAFPLRDDEGRAIVVVDISIGELKELPRLEGREVMRMLKLLQMAYKEISRESREGEKTMFLEAEHNEDTRVEILFDRLMLLELRENVAKLDSRAYAELKSYKEPPKVIHQIIKAVLAVFFPQKARDGEFDNWSHCKQYVNPQLSHKILAYDPTQADDAVPVDLINQYLSEVPHGMVSKHGSIPAQYLYNWVFVCASLIEHTRKMRQLSEQETEAKDAQEKLAANASQDKLTMETPEGDEVDAEQ